ncbi:MAG: hypothetical protein IJ578_04205 [Bacteroidales bacterium]|nr:hypothetical protein [Bacteroidales bacterium]MBR1489421.1 hypothetical protein [Bacteroidales bacterium]
MKRILYWTLAAGVLLTACQKDPVPGETIDGFSVDVTLPSGMPKGSWSSSDKVLLVSQEGSLAPPTKTLSTSGASALTAGFSVSAATAGSSYWFLYPASSFIIASSESMFVMVPDQQQAVSGGVDDAAFLMAGSTVSYQGGVTLSPLTALLKFRLSGDPAADVAEISFTGSSFLTGDARIAGLGSGRPDLSSDATRNRMGQRTTVTLKGVFQAGADYYACVLPGTVSGLDINLVDKDGRSQQMTVSRTLNLSGGAVADLGTLEVEDFAGSGDFAPRFTATKEGINPYVFVFMSDGFTEDQRDTYTQAAQAAIDYIFSVQPFKAMKEYFSAYVCWTPAESAGVGTRWNTTYSGSGTAAMMSSYGQSGRNAIYAYVAENCPEVISGKTPVNNVGIFMLNNNTSYIRPVCDWESSGRFVTPVGLIPNTSAGYSQWCYGGTWQNYDYRDGVKHTLTGDELTALGYATNGRRNGDYREECLHEGAGHGFSRLLDEYWNSGYTGTSATASTISGYHNMSLPTGLNVSGSKEDAPWKALDAMRSELIAKDARYERIGTYEGAFGYETNVYRAEQVSVMMDNRPYFSTWERALMYQRLMRATGEKASFDVTKESDLRAYMEIDVAIGGIADPTRDK